MTDQPDPTDVSERPAELQAPGYEIFISLLAILSLVNLAISFLPWFDQDVKSITKIVDAPITVIFLLDFGNRLRQSHPRRVYFIEQHGWLDLLGSLPAGFKLFRIFRLVRVWRLMSAYGMRRIVHGFIRERANNALLIVIFMVLIVIEFGSMVVVHFEGEAPGANITTGGDAVWWAFVSITTVGYGDKYPITPGGRASAFFVLAAGVALFGVLSGFLANFFLSPAAEDAEPDTTGSASTWSEPTNPLGPPSATAQMTASGAAAALAPDDDASLLRMVADLEASVAALRARLIERAEGASSS